MQIWYAMHLRIKIDFFYMPQYTKSVYNIKLIFKLFKPFFKLPNLIVMPRLTFIVKHIFISGILLFLKLVS